MADIFLAGHLGHCPDREACQGAEAIAGQFGVSRKTVMAWRRAGAPIYLIGRKYQCRGEELWGWLAANTPGPGRRLGSC